ncbi:MAG: glycoside hydrolase family 44 protein [Granulosicoccus sp.]
MRQGFSILPVALLLAAMPFAFAKSDSYILELYDDQLLNGLENWSWTNTKMTDDELVHEGSFAMSATMEPYGGLYLGSNESTSIPLTGSLNFWLFANDSEPLSVVLVDGDGEAANTGVTLQPSPGQWQQISISLQDLGSTGSISGVWWQESSGNYRARLYMDQVSISGDNTGVELPDHDPEQDPTVAIRFYDDQLADGFQNYSWTQTDLTATEKTREGARAIAVDYDSWGGLYIASERRVQLPYSGQLKFSVFASDSDALLVQLVDASDNGGVVVNPVDGQWTDITVPLSQFGQSRSTTGIWIQEYTGQTRQRMYIDDIRILTDGTEPEPQTGITVAVNTGSAVLNRTTVNPSSGESTRHVLRFPRTISEDIYGVSFATNLLREELSLPVNRWGGNATERYNFETSSSNQGRDWYYANNAWDVGSHHLFERENQADGTQSLLTISSMGWVSSGRDGTCSYPTSLAGQQDSTINHWLSPFTNCGNGMLNGELLGSADPSLTSIAVDETHATNWVKSMVRQHGTAAQGGVEMYAIGNEPGLWHYTHGDLQATPLSRAALIDRDIRYANAIKAGDASAKVLGPVLWGGSSYYVAPDELLSGIRPVDVPLFLEDYLSAMNSAAATDGQRLLDYLAVNFYDERVFGRGSDSLRLQSTRHLWDPEYSPEDWWVVRDFLYGNGSAVIPRLKTLIAQNYPGTPLALTEYNFGGAQDASGALAQIDALGIFGREGLDLATLWEPYADYVTTPEAEFSNRPIFWAFRLYRNYDGRGSRFGNVALLTTSSDESTVSAYTARRNDGATTIVLVNKSLAEQRISISGIGGTASAYRYESDSPQAIKSVGEIGLDNGSLPLPAYSATLLVVEP